MPYPTEHAARLKNPGSFQAGSFRRIPVTRGVFAIIGRLPGQTTTTTQAYRFDKNVFTADEAKKWLKDNDVEYIRFEKATGD